MRNFSRMRVREWMACMVFLWGNATTLVSAAPLSIELQTKELPTLLRQQALGDSLALQRIPLDNSRPAVTLQLERFEVFTHDARIVVHGDSGEKEMQAPKNAYYRGQIEGDPDSHAYLVLHETGGLRGLISSAGQYWVLGGETAGGRITSAPRLRSIDPKAEFSKRSFQCENEQLEELPYVDPQRALAQEPDFTPEMLPTDVLPQLVSHTARVAIETDWEFFQKFGNATAATNYIGDLLGYTSLAYENEIGTSLLVSHVSLWSTTGDPWLQTSPSCSMYEFGRYWNDNRGSVQRTVAHFLSGKSSGGGVAWLGVLCNGSFNVNIGSGCGGLTPSTDNYGGGYGYSGDLDGNFNLSNPGIVWDVYVLSHELGHNFNSPHTHCYAGIGGNSNPIDQCYGSESGCYGGVRSLPGPAGQGSGTIMSYCHLISPGLSNISLSLGEGHPYGVAPDRVSTRMSAHVSAAATASPSCLASPRALRIGNVRQGEGNSGFAPFAFPVTLSPASTGTVTVRYGTGNSSATAGSDYTAVPSTLLTFTPGQTSKTVVVNVKGDTTKEVNEKFVVNLTTPNGATIAKSQGIGTVVNDDGPVLRISNASKAEGQTGVSAFTFTVTLTPASTSSATVNYATVNGTATAGSDYTATSGVLTFGVGQTSKTLTVNVKGDTVKEADETFLVKLSNASGTTIFRPQGVGTITNDD